MRAKRWRAVLGLVLLAAAGLPARAGGSDPAGPRAGDPSGVTAGEPAGAPAVEAAGVSPAEPAAPVAGAWRQVHEALAGLEAREKATLAELVRLDGAVREAESRLRQLQSRQEAARAELAAARQNLEAARRAHRERQQKTARLLRLIQFMGPGSYLQVLAGAEDWADFNRRLGALVVTVRSTRAALATLRQSAADLERSEALVSRREAELAQAVQRAAGEAARLEAARAREEQVLEGLGREREAYETRLQQLRSLWVQDVRPYLERVGRALGRLVREGRAVPGTRVELTLAGVQLRVPLQGLNELLAMDPDLRELRFRVRDGAAVLEVPGRALHFEGDFAVRGGNTLVFEVGQGELAGIPLEPGMVHEALGGNELALDLSPALGPWKIRSTKLAGEELLFTLGG